MAVAEGSEVVGVGSRVAVQVNGMLTDTLDDDLDDLDKVFELGVEVGVVFEVDST